MPKITLFMPTFNRREIANVALANLIENTSPGLVEELLVVDCRSTDGLEADLPRAAAMKDALPFPMRVVTIRERHVVAAMQAARAEARTPLIAKVDSDTMVPPGWLERLSSVMERHPELWALGMEPRGEIQDASPAASGYAPAPFVGGIGLFRRDAWKGMIETASSYFGWNEHQALQPWAKGWLRPALRVFLLDFLPFQPFQALQTLYFDRGWHRSRGTYLEAQEDLWGWKYPLWRSHRRADVLVLRDGGTEIALETRLEDRIYVIVTPDGRVQAIRRKKVSALVRQEPGPAAWIADPEDRTSEGYLAYRMDLRRDALSGAWSFAGDALVGVAPDFTLAPGADHGRLLLPGRPPDEYDLSATVTRLEGEGNIGFGLQAGGRPFVFSFDSWRKWSGIFDVDGKSCDQTKLGVEGPFFKNGAPRRIEIRVRAAALEVLVDGREFWRWTADWKRVSRNAYHAVDRPGTLFLAIYRSTYKIADLKLSAPERKA